MFQKKSAKELHSKKLDIQNENETGIPKESYVFPERRQQIIDEFRL